MACSNCIDGICSNRCLPPKKTMLRSLKRIVAEDKMEILYEQSDELISAVYTRAFLEKKTTEQKSKKKRLKF